MSTRRLTLELPVSIYRQLAEIAESNHQSIEETAIQTLVDNLPTIEKKIPKRDEVLAIISEHREQLKAMGVKSLELFGSVARNEATPDSDIDFLIEFARPVGLDFFKVQHFLEDILNCPIDLGFKNSLKQHLREPVLEDVIHVL